MKKKSQNHLKTYGIIIGIILLLGSLAWFGIFNEMYGGGTVLSVSNAKFIKSDTDLGGESAYLIDVVINKGGEQIVGEITPEMLSQYNLESFPSGPFTIYMDLKNVTCDYNIVADNKVFYKIYQASVRNGLCHSSCTKSCTYNSVPYDKIDLNTVKKACKGQWGSSTRHYWSGDRTHYPQYCNKVFAPMGLDTVSPGAPVAGGNCDDLVNIQTSTINPTQGADASEWGFAMPKSFLWDDNHWVAMHIAGLPWYEGYKIDTVANPSFVVELTLKNSKGEIETTTLTNKETTKFLGDIGSAKFVGSLIGQQYCGIPAIEKNIVKDLNTNTMKVVRRVDYEHYQDVFSELINFDNNYYRFERVDPGIGADVLFDKMSSLNADHRKLVTTDIKDNCYIDGLTYKCTPEKDIIYPELQLVVKSDWIGIMKASSQPKIMNYKILTDKILEGTSTQIKVDIKNNGDYADGFDTYLDCENEISLGSVRTAIMPGKTQTIYLNFIGEAGDYDCNIITYSVNDESKKDSKDISFKINERDIPKIETCGLIASQPCEKALWQGYPICKWDTSLCGEQKSDSWKYIIGAMIVVIIGLSIFLIKKKKK